MLEYSSSTPLYIQIKDALLQDISSGKLRPGQKIPIENELSNFYGVSRITIRSAVMELVKSGHLIRQQGKGTFVYKPLLGENIMVNQSFTTVCKESGVTPGSKIVSISIQNASENDIKELEISPNSRILYLERVRYANGAPVILEFNYLPEQFISLMNEPLENESLYAILENKYKLGKLIAVKRIGIAVTDSYQSELLNVKKNTPVLRVREIVYDINNIPIHRTSQFILGDRFEYIVK